MLSPMLFVSVLVLLACGGHVQANCRLEPGWTLGPSKKYCYYVSPHITTWETAQAKCESNDAILATINDATDNKFLAKLIRPEDAWIGFNDRDKEGKWSWEGGSGSSFTNWNTETGEPNNSGNQDCAVIVGVDKFGLKRGKWDDRQCAEMNLFICRRDAQATSPVPLTNASTVHAQANTNHR